MEQTRHIAGNGGNERAHGIGGHALRDFQQDEIARGLIGHHACMGHAPQHRACLGVIDFKLERDSGIAGTSAVKIIGDISADQKLRTS